MEPDDRPAGRGPDAWLDSEQARAAAAAGGAPPPSARVGRRVAEPDPVSPVRALAGAVVAVAGVALGIGAVLTLTEEPDSSLGPTVAAPSLSTTPTTTPTTAPTTTPTTAPTVVTPTAVAPVTSAPAASVTTRPPTLATASPRPPSSPAPRPTPSATPAPVPAVAPLTVLNNSRITGLADRAAGRFAAGGWPIRQVGNFTGQIRTTTVYYLPGQEAVARRFAASFDVPRVLPRFSGLPGSGLTVVLTRDYA